MRHLITTLGPDAVAPLALLAALLVFSFATSARHILAGDRRLFLLEQGRAVRAWTAFVLVYVAYRALANLLPRFVGNGGHGVEDQLRALDEQLLGVSPSWWLARFARPWLTDLMAYGYGLMFFLPLALLLILQARGRWDDFRAVSRSLIVAFALGLVGYLLVPARSPRLAYVYPTELTGHGLYEASSWAWDHLQAVSYDAFPSLHTAVSSISLIWAWRCFPRRRALFWLYLPHVVLLQISTLYLRQHYAVDLAGGWAVAALATAGYRKVSRSMPWRLAHR